MAFDGEARSTDELDRPAQEVLAAEGNGGHLQRHGAWICAAAVSTSITLGDPQGSGVISVADNEDSIKACY